MWLGDTGWIWWAHWGHNLSCMCTLWLPRPKLTGWTNQNQNQKNPRAHACFLLSPLHLCKQDDSDIMKWHHNHLLLHLGRKSLCACTVVMPTCLHIHRCPWPISPHPSMHKLLRQFCIPISMPVTLPRYFGVPSYQCLQFIKNQCNKVSTKINMIKWTCMTW